MEECGEKIIYSTGVSVIEEHGKLINFFSTGSKL